ncbi:efflux RND transporter periplasmic adaptor subunit [Photobacterium japonica]|uniref:efflux RND transporter periplasmic adaptor subunit n=1 Tax=Photobacterium japonica TaxID=2910235 RepID=UPI003D09C151
MRRISTTSAIMLSVLLVGCNSSSSEPDGHAQQNATSTSGQAAGQVSGQQTLSVNTFTLQATDHYTVAREYVGMVQAGQQANLGVELGGKVAKLWVDVGDTVTTGDPLITLDTQMLHTQVDELTARQAQITAQLELIEANLTRQRALKTKGFSAESEMDALRSQRNALKASFRQLTANLNANQLQQQKSTVYAPYDGIVSDRYVSTGDVINTGSPTLTLLASSRKEAHIGIPAKQLPKLAAITDWTLRIGAVTYPASLLNPGANIERGSRTVKLRFALPGDAKVINGELAYLQFQDRHNTAGYWIPLSAMTDGLRGVWNVFALRENPTDVSNSNSNKTFTVERRSIQVLHANNDHAYVEGAISPNEKIIADGLHRLVPGQTVSPVKKLPLPLNNPLDEATL